jgi:hypothetical protein
MENRSGIGHPADEQEDTLIEHKKRWILLLGVAALAIIGKDRGLPASGAPVAPLSYLTRCAVIESNSIDGFVSNQSPDSYRVRGEVRITFVAGGGASRPEMLVQSDVQVPAGETVRVARARLDPPLRAGETCRLDVEAALRRE